MKRTNPSYVVEVPELPGCPAHDATRQDALCNAEDAIRFWIKTVREDGLEIPPPRGRLVYGCPDPPREKLHETMH